MNNYYNYYEILEINEYATSIEIKKQFRKLSLKYHPDKNKLNDSKKFIIIKESYDILIDDDKRRIYDYQRRFSFLKNYNLDEYEIEYLNSLYEKIYDSYEIRFCKILFNTLPSDIRENLNKLKEKLFSEVINENNNKQIIIPSKYINIQELNEDYTINLNISFEDNYNQVLKKIIIHTKYHICYLFLRSFNDIVLQNGKYSFKIKFIRKSNKKYIKKGNDLIIIKNINIYELLYHKEYNIILPNNENININKVSNIILKNKGFLYDYNKYGDCYVIFNLDYSKDVSKYKDQIKEIFN